MRGQTLGDEHNIIGVMLPVGIRGHDADQIGVLAEGVIEAGLERRAFAEVGGVAQEFDAG